MKFRSALLAGALSLSLLPSCSREPDNLARRRTAGDAPASQQVSAGAIAKQPQQFYNRQVTVKSEVEQVQSPTIFTLDEDAVLAGPDVLVIAPRSTTVEGGSDVIVSGTVRQLVITDLQKEYSWFNPNTLQPDLVAKFKERPVIVAQSIRTTDGKDLMGTTHGTAGDAPLGQARPLGAPNAYQQQPNNPATMP